MNRKRLRQASKLRRNSPRRASTTSSARPSPRPAPSSTCPPARPARGPAPGPPTSFTRETGKVRYAASGFFLMSTLGRSLKSALRRTTPATVKVFPSPGAGSRTTSGFFRSTNLPSRPGREKSDSSSLQRECSARARSGKNHPRFEAVPRDDRSSKNQPKRVENGRDRSL